MKPGERNKFERNLLRCRKAYKLLAYAAAELGPNYDIEIALPYLASCITEIGETIKNGESNDE